MEQLIARICQELGIAPTTDEEAILNHIRALKTNFADQVKQISHIPLPTEIEGHGPTIR